MLQIQVKPLDEHNPEGVLELLNSYKNNLSTLLLQYNTIIETYLKILGIDGLGLANVNEIILPEIESLLSKHNCKFTEKGIYSNGESIFYASINESNHPTINIKNGENYCKISKEIINAQKGLFVTKNIRDFSNLDESVKQNLSYCAMTQIDSISSPKEKELLYFPLESITILKSVAEGIELLKRVDEYYKYDDGKQHLTVTQLFRLDIDGPTMHYQCKVDIPDDIPTGDHKKAIKVGNHYEFGELTKQVMSLYRNSLYSVYSFPYNYGNIDAELFYYGESKLYYNPNNIIHKPKGCNPYREYGGTRK